MPTTFETGGEFRIAITAEGFVNVSILYPSKGVEWHKVAPAYDVDDLIDSIWDLWTVPIHMRKAVHNELRKQVDAWTRRQGCSDSRWTWNAKVEAGMAIMVFVLVAVLAWIVQQ